MGPLVPGSPATRRGGWHLRVRTSGLDGQHAHVQDSPHARRHDGRRVLLGRVSQQVPQRHPPTVDRDLPARRPGVAIVAYSDDVLTCRGFARRGGERIDADRELIALGTANIARGRVPAGSPGSAALSWPWRC